jgi:signal transduction histidine kinase
LTIISRVDKTRSGLDADYMMRGGAGAPSGAGHDQAKLGQRQLAAIARAASSVADAASLEATLDAVAHAVFDSTVLAAVQILVLRGARREFEVLGSAGHANITEFGPLLDECRRLGAQLEMLTAIDSGEPVVVPHRRDRLLGDPAWAPMHELMSSFSWDTFVSVPLLARDRCVGVLNAFYAPGQNPDAEALAFLSAIADQAAMAVDYTELLARAAAEARRSERKRFTRDLHDSIVQQVFSLRMHASALSVQLEDRDEALERGRLLEISHELADLSESALVDLRELMYELRPGSLRGGLLDAVTAHAARIQAGEGLEVVVDIPDVLPELPPALENDLYRIVQEALHNTVKHAAARVAHIRFTLEGDALIVEVRDDGGDAGDHAEAGADALGLVSMRERARQWGGDLTAAASGDGFSVRVVITDLTLLIARSGAIQEEEPS